jgi:cysteinyl-tRNA synthetase
MSKSIGNIVSIKDYVKNNSGNHLRLLIYSSHYTAPMNVGEELNLFIDKGINKIVSLIFKIMTTFDKIDFIKKTPITKRIIEELENDLNTANVISIIDEELKEINKSFNDEKKLKELFNQLINDLEFLGFVFNYESKHIVKYKKELKDKNYKTSDELRSLIENNILHLVI